MVFIIRESYLQPLSGFTLKPENLLSNKGIF
nr:MAG TPA: hypothetical protein [Caudoviricetes sp.]